MKVLLLLSLLKQGCPDGCPQATSSPMAPGLDAAPLIAAVARVFRVSLPLPSASFLCIWRQYGAAEHAELRELVARGI